MIDTHDVFDTSSLACGAAGGLALKTHATEAAGPPTKGTWGWWALEVTAGAAGQRRPVRDTRRLGWCSCIGVAAEVFPCGIDMVVEARVDLGGYSWKP
jgi:hypothetical protein